MPRNGGSLRSLALVGQGFSFAAIVGVMAWLGHLADEKFGTDPWLLIAGTLVGVVVAVYDLIRMLQAWERKGQDRDA